mgnify:CR=1
QKERLVLRGERTADPPCHLLPGLPTGTALSSEFNRFKTSLVMSMELCARMVFWRLRTSLTPRLLATLLVITFIFF